jgi:hypothetical protein
MNIISLQQFECISADTRHEMAGTLSTVLPQVHKAALNEPP